MNLVLIACSARKTRAGEAAGYRASPALTVALRPATLARLMDARAELAHLVGCSPGPDLGSARDAGSTGFLPAYLRYTGVVYTTADLPRRYPRRGAVRVAIVSALYGLLDADDLVRYYDLAMDAVLPNGQTVHRWWKARGLGEIVAEYVGALDPATVHDLLSTSYRRALAPWPAPALAARLKSYRYPGQGSGSSYSSGHDLARLLDRDGG